MKTAFFILIVFFSAGITACGGEKEQKQTSEDDLETLRAEVMQLHDEVMPLTADIQARIKAIKSDTARLSDSVRALMIMDLEAADKAMWDWMAGFEDPEDNFTVEEKYIYYKEQKESIENVAKKINESLEKSDKILER